MIRFVKIHSCYEVVLDDDGAGKDGFAFYNTVRDEFVDIDGAQVFGSYSDLERELKWVRADQDFSERLLSKVPDEFRS